MNEFYNYIAYVDGLPIYVGKGKGKRFAHCYKKFQNCEVILYNALTELYYVYKG